MNKIRVRDSTFNTFGAVESQITSHQTPINVVICPQAGRAFTLFIRVVSVFIGPHDPLRSTTAAESKQSARLCRLAQPKNLFHPAKPREPPLRQNWGLTPNPTYFFCLATEKVCKKRSSPCILADLPRLAPGTKRTRLRLKQLFVLSFASPGRCPSADARDGSILGALFIQRSLQDLKQHCFFTAPLHDGSKALSRGGAAFEANQICC